MRYEIEIRSTAQRELRELPAFVRASVLAAMHDKLETAPLNQTRNIKPLAGRVSGYGDLEIWECRVGEIRIFYDVNKGLVRVHAVRRKRSGQTTEEVFP